ncbi:MAG: heparan-alpha-glucosaminide N-acetyltransferase [Methylotenera sp.]
MNAENTSTRYALIDLLRGLAITCMIAYHFSFDLNQYGVIHQNFNESTFWLSARAVIVTSFLMLMGMSLVLATLQKSQHYWQRILKLAGCAALVTIGSKFMFPESYIFFGILHFILIASLIGALMLRFYWANLALGISFLLLGIFYKNAVFDQPLLQWLGLMTFKPFTEDYVPMLPWLGVVLLGIFFAQWLVRKSHLNWLTGSQTGWRTGFVWLGKRSLMVYMLHQPILLGILWLVLGR